MCTVPDQMSWMRQSARLKHGHGRFKYGDPETLRYEDLVIMP